MQIRIGNIKIDTRSRVERHREHLLDQIFLLRSEIIDLVLTGEARNRISVKDLKHRAKLIKKYSRRLKLLRT